MHIYNKIIISTLLLALSPPALPIVNTTDDLCEPFKEVDHTLIDTMLKAAVDGDLYRVKKDSSKMGFCVKSSIGLVKGNFQSFQGGMALNEKNKQTMLSIDVASLDTNVFFINSLLKSDDFFNVDDHPKLTFISHSFERINDKQAVLKGKLTMRGVTKVVAFYIDITEVDGELGDSHSILIKATTTVQRSKFGMNALQGMVNDRVSLCMSIEAEKFNA